MKISKYFFAGILSLSVLALANNSRGMDSKSRLKNFSREQNPSSDPSSPSQPGSPANPPTPGNPDQPIPPDPNQPIDSLPPSEIVKMNIQFESIVCFRHNNTESCSMSNINPRGDQSITLQSHLYLCADPTRPDSDPSNPKCPFDAVKEGYWIDLGRSPKNQRLIGIITIKKWIQKIDTTEGSPNEQSWYEIEVEVLGKNKTLVQMSGRLNSWNQLQPVKLLAEENENDYSNSKAYLRFGPALFPTPNTMSDGRSALDPIHWKVTKGKIIP